MKGAVEEIIKKAGAREGHIQKLVFEGHGGSGRFELGKDVVGVLSGEINFAAELSRLKPYLAPGATVILLGCSVGAGTEGDELVKKLSLLLDTTVVAPKWIQLALSPNLIGPTVSYTRGKRN